MRWMLIALALVLTACSGGDDPVTRRGEPPLYPNETPELRRLINHYADHYDVPAALIHRLIDRESDYRPHLRAGPYYGLLQMLPETARTMGHRGPASELLDPDQNLRWGVKYLRGAFLLSGGDFDGAIRRYASGYYYEARDRCMLVETGLAEREMRSCR
ncbi:transglycosylase SLT domain-containing protein [Nioella sp.]|uniref:transglycosylase SLT domain-containing protein n=1 Tax=Nioella sp. TaxID=1912091 RepID=UPI003B51774C